MEKIDKIQQLHRLFTSHRYPIPIRVIAEKLECSHKTAKGYINILRDYLHAPLIYEQPSKGWHYDKSAEKFELPGLWLTAKELLSLSTILNLLDDINEGLLGKEISVVQKQLKKLIASRGIAFNHFISLIKYIPTNKRSIANNCFSTLIESLIKDQQLTIQYTDYQQNKSQRTISPQRLIHYQENWYIDAWCHKRQALRSFMLPRITKAIKEKESAVKISAQELDQYYQSSYGIFAGEAKHTAVLKFYPPVISEVSSIEWHPEQASQTKNDHYLLSIPYNDDRELIRDILKYGSNVVVLSPSSLRRKVTRIIQKMAEQYIQTEKYCMDIE